MDDEGRKQELGKYSAGELVFASDAQAFSYMLSLAKRDLQYRGMRDDRLWGFHWKQQANFLLYRKVKECPDVHEYERLRQHWNSVNRPKYRNLKWSSEQAEALRLIDAGVSHEDEEAKRNSRRWLYIQGAPGSGKSAVLLEAAVQHCKVMQVLIVCPTGYQIYCYKAMLPDIEGIENIRVDTIQGVLKYKHPSMRTWSGSAFSALSKSSPTRRMQSLWLTFSSSPQLYLVGFVGSSASACRLSSWRLCIVRGMRSTLYFSTVSAGSSPRSSC